MTRDEAFKLIYAADTPMSKRLEAHSVILDGVLDLSPEQRLTVIARAVGDICIALTRIGAR